MTQTQATVRRHVIVDSAIDRAFSVFTERFGDFKPPEHNLLSATLAETIFEPRVGVTSSTEPSMVPNVDGRASSSTSRRFALSSVGISALNGPSRRTRT